MTYRYRLDYAIAYDCFPCAYCGFSIHPGEECWVVDTNPANPFAKTMPNRVHVGCLDSYLKEEAEHEGRLQMA